jgi:hypothetical protein
LTKLLLIVAATCVFLLVGCGSGGPSASDVAEKAGATTCEDSGYFIGYRTDHTEHTIYNCQIAGETVCVIEDHGLATDVTAQARVVFASSLGGKRPACLN